MNSDHLDEMFYQERRQPIATALGQGQLIDLAIAYSDLQSGLGMAASASRILDEAETTSGPSPRIALERPICGAGLSAADCSRARSVLDHFDLGLADLRAGRFAEAAREFERVLYERTQDFWPNFYAGLCAYRLGRFEEACSAFRVCIALAPDRALCYFNRARAAEALGRFNEAKRDYAKAVALDPQLAPGRLNRAVLLYNEGRYEESIAELNCALRSRGGSKMKGQVHFNLALAHSAWGDRDKALANARAAADYGYKDAAALLAQPGITVWCWLDGRGLPLGITHLYRFAEIHNEVSREAACVALRR
jgi:Flp pilus assembly protein TadD